MLTTFTATIFRCPRCQSTPLNIKDAGLQCPSCQWASDVEAGVLDLLAPEDAPPRIAVDDATGEKVRGLASALGWAGTAQELTRLSATFLPVKPTGNSFFDAEEEIFLERFGINNFDVQPHLGPVYMPHQAETGSVFWGTVRVTNRGSFPILSEGGNSVVLSYHIYQDGKLIEFEGRRTPLPVALKPGMAVTVPIAIHAPSLEGRYEIVFTPLQEGLAWLENYAVTASVNINPTGVRVHPDATEGKPFSENLDTMLAAGFVDSTFPMLDGGTVLEIGGGIRPSFQSSTTGQKWPGIFINCDVSLRLLRVASVLAAPRGQSQVIQVRMDANRLALCDQTIDAVFISRAIHHFADLRMLLNELGRVLKAGGSLYLLCEPIGTEYDDFVKKLIAQGVNEQIFPAGVYEKLLEEAGFTLSAAQVDWGFSFKGHSIRNNS